MVCRPVERHETSDRVVTIDQDSPHVIGTAGKEIWATGGWSSTIRGENFGPIQVKGYWSVIRVGDDWKIRMLTRIQPQRTRAFTASPDNEIMASK